MRTSHGVSNFTIALSVIMELLGQPNFAIPTGRKFKSEITNSETRDFTSAKL